MNHLNTYIMKKSKLSLEKFKIAALNNPSKIIGGTGGANNGDLTNGTGQPNEEPQKNEQCYDKSNVIIIIRNPTVTV
jgi:hypothetical protein